jgi:polyisoprenoid-binding protein YceI
MPTTDHTYVLGPDDAQLTVRTGKSGAAAKAGHNLLIAVTSWQATFALGGDSTATTLTVTVDSGSLRVLDGTGGIQSLSDEDKANIEKTIADEILEGAAIEFRSSEVSIEDGFCRVEGELQLGGNRAPLAFDLTLGAEGHLSGKATVKQSEWGMKPYSTLFGTLKVNDEVLVGVDGQLPAA